MQCPDCGHDNIAGDALCANCGQDLTALDTPGARNELETSLTEAPVAQLDPKAPIFVPADATLAQAIATLERESIGAVLVGDAGSLAGIFSERDVLLRVAGRGIDLETSMVVDFMTTPVETIAAEAPIAFALNRMSLGDFRHLPVTRDERLVGVISLRDVLAFLSRTYPELIPS